MIKRTDVKDMYSLSPMQEGMLFYYIMDKTSTAYFEQSSYGVSGEIDHELFERAFNRLIERHEALRTIFIFDKTERSLQIVLKKREAKIYYKDISHLDENKKKTYINNFKKRDKYLGFDLSRDILIRLAILKKCEKSYEIIWSFHHIIMDGWCTTILIKEMLSIYSSIRDGKPVNLPGTVPYSTYIKWLENQNKAEGLEYWRKYLENFESLTGIPKSESEQDDQYKQEEYRVIINKAISGRLNRLANENNVTINMIFQALWGVLLQKLNNTNDVLFGSVVSGRPADLPDIERIVGLFINTIPVRIQNEPDETFERLIRRTKKETNLSQKYGFVPLSEIQSTSRLKRNLLDHILVFENYPLDHEVKSVNKNRDLGFSISSVDSFEQTNYDLNVAAYTADQLNLVIRYNSLVYEPVLISKIEKYLTNIVQQICADSRIRISEIEIVSGAERKQLLYDFNNTKVGYTKGKTISELFEKQVRKSPGSIAIIGSSLQPGFMDREVDRQVFLTYKELNRQAYRLAYLLRASGVTSGAIAAIMLERSIEMMICILGVLHAGGTYLPLDPDYPEERIEYILKDSVAKVLLSQKSTAGPFKRMCHLIDVEDPLPSHPGSGSGKFSRNPKILAYVTYTSGSTGKPKGVMIENKSLVNFLKGITDIIPFGPKYNILSLTTISFDIFALEAILPLTTGSKVFIGRRNEQLDPRAAASIIEREEITIFQTTPSRLQLFISDHDTAKSLRRLKYLLVGGEAFPGTLLIKVKEMTKAGIYNLYGPTETTVWSTVKDLTRVKSVNIGIPIANTFIYILSSTGGLQPFGVVGELCISGDGVAEGYLNKPELTHEKFAYNSFEMGTRLYRTGDRARWLPDGNIEFLGRIDYQVKIRGFRIELAEIEGYLLKHKHIKKAVVLALEDEKDGYKYLCAYIVGDKTLTVFQLREHLAKSLPDYMIPAYFVLLDELPLTSNGKIDRNALPAPGGIGLKSAVEYIPPRTMVEKKLVETWQSVLRKNPIGINENFFEIGGDSIKTIQIASRMSKAGYKLEIRDIFQNPYISDLAPLVKEIERKADQSVITGTIHLTPVQKWFFENIAEDSPHLNDAVILYWYPDPGEISREEAIRTVFSQLQKHHDGLRITYKKVNREIIQINHGDQYPLLLQVHDLRKKENAEKLFEVQANEIQSGINLETGPLMKLGLFYMDEGDRLLIVIHRLIVDNISWNILLEDIAALYRKYIEGDRLLLPLKTDSFKGWAERLREYANSDVFLEEKTYWEELESKRIPGIKRDFSRIETGIDNEVRDFRISSFVLGEKETQLLLTKAIEAFNTEVIDLLLTALGIGIKKTFGNSRVLIALEGSSRAEISADVDIHRTLGKFTAVYPVILDISFENDWGHQIKEIKETLRRVPNKGIGYGILNYLTKKEKKEELKFKLNPQVFFNYWGQLNKDIDGAPKPFEITRGLARNICLINRKSNIEIILTGVLIDRQLMILVYFDGKQYNQRSIETLLDHYKNALVRIISYCSQREMQELTPSDFTYPKLTIQQLEQLQKKYANAIEEIYTLSPMQEGMLFYAIYTRENTFTYFEQLSYHLYGELDAPCVEKSLNVLFKHHDVLRTAFVYDGLERPLQVVLKERNVDFHFEDLREYISDNQSKVNMVRKFLDKDRQRSFDLSKDVLMRVTVLQLGDTEHQVTWSFHHILMDGWCIGILVSQFSEIYSSYREGRVYQLPTIKPYRVYIQWLEAQEKKKSKNYWQQYLQRYQEIATIPKAKNIKAIEDGYKAESVGTLLERSKTGRLYKLAIGNNVTINTLMQTVWAIVLGKYNGTGDVVFGAVVSGRPPEIEGVEAMVGCFINTIPVRINYEEDTRFTDLIRKVQQNAIDSEHHHYYPLAEIQSESVLKQNLLDHIMEFVNYPIAEQIEGIGDKIKRNAESQSLTITKVNLFEQGNYDFNVLVIPKEQLSVSLNFNANVYDRDLVERVGLHSVHVLEQIINDEEITIAKIVLLTEEEKRQILFKFNNKKEIFYSDETIYQLMEKCTGENPDRIAVACRDIGLTYRCLNERINQMAGALRTRGIQQEEVVGILLERSPLMIESILATWKAGGAYIPLDSMYPAKRVIEILNDSRANLLIIGEEHLNVQLENEFQDKIIKLDSQNKEMHQEIVNQNRINLDREIDMNSLAYVIYTSGSTGKPKGVMVEHIGMMNHIQAKINDLQLTDKSIVAQNASHTFDISIWQFFVSLTIGGKTIIYSDEFIMDPNHFISQVARDQVTILEVVPSYLAVFLEDTTEQRNLPLSLQYLLVTGEEIKPHLVKKWFDIYPDIKMVNAYGPTEASDDITHYIMDSPPDMERIPIGKPLRNLNIYIVDHRMQLCPIGIRGEICVSGVGVGRGYLGDEEKTKQFFMEDPFISPMPGESSSSFTNDQCPMTNDRSSNPSPNDYIPTPITTHHSPLTNTHPHHSTTLPLHHSPHTPLTRNRLYKTGDLGAWLPDGTIEFFGRKDYQVKIRGFRIELGEIENRLLIHPGIKEAVVIDREDDLHNKYLCAYMVPLIERSLNTRHIKEYLQESLPDFMIPSYFVQLEQIPLTSNQKVNRNALPVPEEVRTKKRYTPPMNFIEIKLVNIWSEVLFSGDVLQVSSVQTHASRPIGIDENFFELGGHSLKAIALISKVHKEFNVKLPMTILFKTPTIKELARYIETTAGNKFTAIKPIEKKEYYATSSAQKRLYILHHLDVDSTAYNLSGVIALAQKPDFKKLEDIFMKLIERHESLRTSFHMVEDKSVQKVHDAAALEFKIEYYELSNDKAGMVEVNQVGGSCLMISSDQLIRHLGKSFDLSQSPLLRVGIVKINKEEYVLAIVMHHIISDDASNDIFFKDYMTLCNDEELSPLRIQYKDFSQWQNSDKEMEGFKQQETYWLKQFQGEIPVLNIPTDYSRPTIQSFAGDSTSFEIPGEHTMLLRSIGLEENATLQMVVLATFVVLLSKLSGQEDIVIGTPILGRSHVELVPVMGMFVNTMAMRNYPRVDMTWREFLKDVKERTLEAFENQDYPFEDLVDKVEVNRDAGRNPIFDVMFIFKQFIGHAAITSPPKEKPQKEKSQIENPVTKHLPESKNPIMKTAKFDMIWGVTESTEKLSCFVEYCIKILNKMTIERFVLYFKQLVSSIVNNPGIRLCEIDIIPEKQKKQILYDFNDTGTVYPKDVTIHQLFERQIKKTPGHIALIAVQDYNSATGIHPPHTWKNQVTYKELNEKSHGLSFILKEKGINPDTIVGIMVNPSEDTIIGIIAVLKAGGAYLPIDPGYPAERIQYILTDSTVPVLLTTRDLSKKIICVKRRKDTWKGETVFLDAGHDHACSVNHLSSTSTLISPPHPLTSSPTRLCYVIYTSGTSGQPKGALIEHKNLVRLMFNDKNPFDFGSHDTWTLFHSYCFDFSVWEMYGALLHGGKLVIIPKIVSMDPGSYLNLLEEEKVTVLNQTPSAFYQFSHQALSNGGRKLYLRYIIFGGEALSVDRLKEWYEKYPGIKLINMYGITETTVHVTYKEIGYRDVKSTANNIGKPIPTLTAYVLDKSLKLVPLGVAGELCIGGEGVGRGYLNNPTLTREKFVKITHIPGNRFYKSGDLGKLLPPGDIEYLGRIDHQVKIRGYRIELGEIEHQLLKHDGIKESVVIPGKNDAADKYLCAYIVPCLPDSFDNPSCLVKELREYLSKTLPDYMIPTYFTPIEKIPLTGNGKIDRKALPSPGIISGPELTVPRYHIDRALVEIWSGVLGIVKEKIGIDNNFFEMGGHSLKAVELISKIHKELNVKLPLAEIFKTPTIRGLSGYIKNAAKDRYITIEPSERKEYYALSSAQKRLYFLQQMDLESTVYNITNIIQLSEKPDGEKFEETFARLIARHESFRTSYEMINEQPVQRIHGNIELKIEHYKVDVNVVEIFKQPFDLGKAPLLRVGVGITGGDDEKYFLLVVMHHIISDGISQDIMAEDFLSLYKGEDLPSLKIQYKDFSQWHNNEKEKGNLKKQEEYWLKQFEGETPVLNLLTDYTRPVFQSFEGSTVSFEIEKIETQSLKNKAREEGVTLFMLLLAITNILLAKLSNQEDIVVGTPVVGRRHADLEKIIGMFVNTLPLRNYPEGKKKFENFLKEVKERTLEAFENQEYQFEDMVEKVSVNRDTGRNPLFDVMFLFESIDDSTSGKSEPKKPGSNKKQDENEYIIGTSKFDITLYAAESAEKLFFTFEYCTKLFKKETIERFILYFKKILPLIVKESGIELGQIEIIGEEERRKILYDFNNTKFEYPGDKTIHVLFKEQVEKSPNHVALVFDPLNLTYRELNKRSNDTVRLLRSKGLQPDTIVGIMMDRSVEMITGILGILKAGGAYLPIAPQYPADRVKYMLTDSSAPFLIINNSFCPSWLFSGSQALIDMSEGHHLNLPASQPPSFPASLPSGLAYVIYTSGSTGKPKGVMITHRSLVNTLSALCKEYPLYERDAYLFKTSFLFDVSVTEIFGWFWQGGRLAILEKDAEKDPAKILEQIEHQHITHINFVPSMFKAFVESLDEQNISKLSSLRYIFLAGEELLSAPVRTFKKFASNVVLENIYGPTEAAIYASKYSIQNWHGTDKIPIGKPLNNTKIYILGQWNNLQPVGVPGELGIAGVGVARGYLNNPELTKEKFIKIEVKVNVEAEEEPFGQYKQPCSHAAMQSGIHASLHYPITPIPYYPIYRTGDLAKWLPDGNIEFLGRIDHQVKIRGFRIEPGEIERQLLKRNDIEEVIVTARESKAKDKYLCANVVSTIELTAAELREYLFEKLPDYMIPSYFVFLESIPLTSNGKVDYSSLPVPEPESIEKYTAPGNTIEKKLVELWSEILEIKKEVIGIYHNFFELGGHSLKAIILLSKIHKELNVKIPIPELFKKPTIKGLSGYIQEAGKDRYTPVEPGEKKDYYFLSSAQKRLYIIQHMDLNSTAYHMPNIIYLTEKPNIMKLEDIFLKLIKRHESLRTSFHLVKDQPVQRVHENVVFSVEYYEVGNLISKTGNKKGLKEIVNIFEQPFDLSKPPFLKGGVIKLEDEKYVLVVIMHHIITDGVSHDIFQKEFFMLYGNEKLPPRPIQYKDFSQWQNKLFETGEMKSQERYWMNRFEGKIPRLNVPTDYPRPAIKNFEGKSISCPLNKEISKKLHELTGKTGTTLYMALLAAYNILLYKYTRQEDIIIGSPITGRRHADLQNIIGMFVNMLAVRSKPTADKTFRDFLLEVKETVIGAMENQDFQFDELVAKLALQVDKNRNPLFDVVLAMQNMVSGKQKNTDKKNHRNDNGSMKDISRYRYELRKARFDLTLFVSENNEDISIALEYSTEIFKDSKAVNLIEHYIEILGQLVENYDIKLKDVVISHGLLTSKSNIPEVDGDVFDF